MAHVDTSEWEARAWEGVLVEVPAEWDIAAISGNRKQGYLRIDDEEKMPRVELKWQEESGFVDIEGVVDGYLKDLQKKKKNEPEIEVDRDTSVVSKRQMGKQDLNCFSWSGEVNGYGAAWYCPDCERVIVIQVMAKPEENGEALASAVIANVQDHPREGWVTWSTYGLQMQTPERFELSEQKLMAGLIQLQFESQGEEIVAGRWGMANVALSNSSLEKWAKKEVRQYHKGVRLSYEETQFRGHEAVLVTGYFSNPLRHLQSFVMHVMGKPYPEAVRGWVWHSEAENRIYYAAAMLDEDNMELAAEVARRVVCPEGDVDESDEEREPIR